MSQDWAAGLQPVPLGSTRREFHHERASLHLIFDAIEPTKEGLRAWVEARYTGNPGARLLHFGTYNLMGSRTVGTLASAIGQAVPAAFPEGAGPDWRQVVNAAVYDIVSEHLVGAEPVDLATVPDDERPKWLLRPFLTASGSSGLVAAGGTGKSLLALSLAFSVAIGRAIIKGMPPQASGPVLYLDWEDDATEHRERLAAIAAGAGLDLPEGAVHYVRQTGAPLSRNVTQLEKRVAELGAVMVVVDSTMLARGGDAISAEANTAYHAALRQLGVPALTVEHKSADAIAKNRRGVYGSVVNENNARMLWEFVTVERDNGTARFRLEQTKMNRGTFPPEALEAEIVTDDRDRLVSVGWRRIDPQTVRVISAGDGAPLIDQICDVLDADGPLSYQGIADAIGKGVGTVRKTVSRYPNRVHQVPDSYPHEYAVGAGPIATGTDDLPDPI